MCSCHPEQCEKAEHASNDNEWIALYSVATDHFTLAAARGHSDAQYRLGSNAPAHALDIDTVGLMK
jgi:hypothetical protein